MRRETPEISWGDWKILKLRTPSVLAMQYDWNDRSTVAVHNFSDRPRPITLRPKGAGKLPLVNLLSHDHSAPDPQGRHHVELEPYGYRWFRVGGIERALGGNTQE
jgi:maltose alpha-D-glucosyltransferase/alpha-amylase